MRSKQVMVTMPEPLYEKLIRSAKIFAGGNRSRMLKRAFVDWLNNPICYSGHTRQRINFYAEKMDITEEDLINKALDCFHDFNK